MVEITPVLIFAGIILLVCGFVVFGLYHQKQRLEALAAYAARRGWKFDASGEGELARLERFALMSRGRSRRAANLMRGGMGNFEASVFDYRYTTGSAKNSTTYRQTVIVLSGGGLDLPAFELSAENFLTRFIERFGYQDIDFPAQPEFSKKYLLRGQNEQALRALFRSELLEYLASRPAVSIEGQGDSLIWFYPNQCTAPDMIDSQLQAAEWVAKSFANSRF